MEKNTTENISRFTSHEGFHRYTRGMLFHCISVIVLVGVVLLAVNVKTDLLISTDFFKLGDNFVPSAVVSKRDTYRNDKLTLRVLSAEVSGEKATVRVEVENDSGEEITVSTSDLHIMKYPKSNRDLVMKYNPESIGAVTIIPKKAAVISLDYEMSVIEAKVSECIYCFEYKTDEDDYIYIIGNDE